MELHVGVGRFIFPPRVMPNPAGPAVSMMSGRTAVASTGGGATNEPFQ